jgi:hypothetical protein
MAATASVSCLALAISAGVLAQTSEIQLDRILRVNRVRVDSAVRSGSVGVDVELQNLSSKTITAYRCSWSASYADGTRNQGSGWGTDLLYGDVVPKMPDAPSGPQLGPGKTYLGKASVPIGLDGSPPASVAVTITMIVFDDGTALGDPWAAQAIAQVRRAYAKDRADLIAELRDARAAATSDKDLANRLDQLAAAGPQERAQAIMLFAQVLPAGRKTFDRMIEIWDSQGRAVGQDKLGAAPDSKDVPLSLKVERGSGQLQLSWDRSASIVQSAQRARLFIVDGDRTKDIPLDTSQLRGGSFTYSPVTSDVTFRLEVTDPTTGRSASESIRVTSTVSPAANPKR